MAVHFALCLAYHVALLLSCQIISLIYQGLDMIDVTMSRIVRPLNVLDVMVYILETGSPTR